MDFHAMKTTVIENQALGKTRRQRSRQLKAKARRLRRRKLTAKQREAFDNFRRVSTSRVVQPALGDEEKQMARTVRDLKRPDPDITPERKAHADALLSEAMWVYDKGAIGRRYLHLAYCFFRGRMYREVEKKVRTCPAPEEHNPGRTFSTAEEIECNKPKVNNLMRAITSRQKEWGLAGDDVPTYAQLAYWLEEGKVSREEILEFAETKKHVVTKKVQTHVTTSAGA